MPTDGKNRLDELRQARDAALAELVKESDPKNWPDMKSQQGRGDRYWMKKNAIATVELIESLNTAIGLEASISQGSAPHQKVDPKLRREAEELLKKHAKSGK